MFRKSARDRKRRGTTGQLPGTLFSDPAAYPPSISIINYGNDIFQETEDVAIADLASYRQLAPVLWLDIAGLGDIELIKKSGEVFALHNLALEDVTKTHQRPKIENYDEYIYIVTRMNTPGKPGETEQLSMFLGKDYVLSIRENPGDCFGGVRDRIRKHHGRIRQAGADYLAYSLLDTVIDGYFPVLEKYGEQVDELETAVLDNPDQQLVHDIHFLKHRLLEVRRDTWSHREMVNSLLRDDSELINEPTMIYLRDVYDHAVQQVDIVETYRDVTSGLIDIYLSSVSARMNEVMKVLTVIATIFMPLSFIAGVFGMNFDRSSPWNMPELGWRFGYIYALLLMSFSAGGLLYYFRRKRWLGKARRGKVTTDKSSNR